MVRVFELSLEANNTYWEEISELQPQAAFDRCYPQYSEWLKEYGIDYVVYFFYWFGYGTWHFEFTIRIEDDSQAAMFRLFSDITCTYEL